MRAVAFRWANAVSFLPLLTACGEHITVAERDVPDAGIAADAGTNTHTAIEGGTDPGVTDAAQGVFLCGTSRCINHPTVVAGVTLNGLACCFDAKRSACGAVELDQCIELNQPGKLDPT